MKSIEIGLGIASALVAIFLISPMMAFVDYDRYNDDRDNYYGKKMTDTSLMTSWKKRKEVRNQIV